MCHHIPIDEREAFAEKRREEQARLDDAGEETTEADEEFQATGEGAPDEEIEPMAMPTDD